MNSIKLLNLNAQVKKGKIQNILIISNFKIASTIPVWTLSCLNYPLSSHPLQAVNCCRNSRLVVDEDDFGVGGKLRKIAMYS